MISVTADTRQLRKAARKMGKAGDKAVRPAVKKALTRTAAKARLGEQENLRTRLDRVKQFTLNSIGYQPAKEEGRYVASRVFVKPAMAGTLLRLEVGGEIRGAVIPKAVVQDRFGNLGKNGKQKLLARSGTFEAKVGGRLGIYRRHKATGRLQLLVGYYDRATYGPQLGFREKGLEFGEGMPEELDRAFNEIFKALVG